MTEQSAPQKVLAQQAATLHSVSGGRSTLGPGSGENVDEHVIGEGWPTVAQRQDMFEEAITIIRELLTGDLLTRGGPVLSSRFGHV